MIGLSYKANEKQCNLCYAADILARCASPSVMFVENGLHGYPNNRADKSNNYTYPVTTNVVVKDFSNNGVFNKNNGVFNKNTGVLPNLIVIAPNGLITEL